MHGKQRVHNAFHFYSARSLDEKQIAGLEKLLDENAGFVGRREEFCFGAIEARGNCTFDDLGCVTRNADDPIHFSRLCGGRPGFVRIDDDITLTVPDYMGNFFFNTIGNLLSYPRIGPLFIDFESGDLLQLTGEAEVVWEGEALAAHGGAKRLSRIRPVAGRWLRRAFPIRLSFREVSPQAVAVASHR